MFLAGRTRLAKYELFTHVLSLKGKMFVIVNSDYAIWFRLPHSRGRNCRFWVLHVL